MAKKQGDGITSTVVLRNLSSGPRDYPLNDGGSIYLPSRGKGVAWPEIPASQVSKALLLAEKKGAIELIEKIEKDDAEAPKEASE